VTLRGIERQAELSQAYRAVLSTVFADTDSKPNFSDSISASYSCLIYELQTMVTQTDRVFSRRDTGRFQPAMGHGLHVSVDSPARGSPTGRRRACQAASRQRCRCRSPPSPHRKARFEGSLGGKFSNSVVPPTLETPLQLAISAGHDSTVLLTPWASAATGYRGATALHTAALHGALDFCRFMVDWDANLVDARTEAQLTPFH
jgi:hypothetical protein